MPLSISSFKTQLMKTNLLILILLISAFTNLSAQDGFILKRDSLQSEILSQNRKLDIYLPDGYEDKDTRFPVIYVLDAEGRDQHTVPTARFLFLNNKMPKVIIVGVKNIDRNHDFLPDSTKGTPTGGGADKFIQFFKDELIPYIDKKFKSESYRVLIGHSFGGLFAIHALLNDPGLFNAYIAIDPSVWYKNRLLLKSAEKEFGDAKDWDKSLFVTGREGEGMNEMGINSLDTLLKKSAPEDLSWKIAAYSDEDHGSVTFKSVYDGLRYLFDSGSSLNVFPDRGIVPAGVPFTVYLWNISPEMRYTTDGSEPTAESPKCQTKLDLTGGCQLKIKSLTKKYNTHPTATYIFRQENYLQGLQSVKNLKQGLRYKYYEGAWDSLPDFSKLTPLRKGTTETVTLPLTVKKDSFALQFEGYLHITEKAMYYFWITSDDGSELYLNNQLILENNGLHSADIPKVAILPLGPGYYPISIKYFEKTGEESIAAGMVKGLENPSPQPFAKELLFYKE